MIVFVGQDFTLIDLLPGLYVSWDEDDGAAVTVGISWLFWTAGIQIDQ